MIEVTVRRCEKTRCVGLPACDKCAAMSEKKRGEGKAGKATANLPAAGADDRKFFQLPSLGSKAGAASTVGYAAKTHHYTTVSASKNCCLPIVPRLLPGSWAERRGGCRWGVWCRV
jgi:hypothetical protein